MAELNLNNNLIAILTSHRIPVSADQEFVYLKPPLTIKLRARAIYNQVNNYVTSQMDLEVITGKGERISETFGDFGTDSSTTINKNLLNFSSGVLHVLLAAFGSDDADVLNQITLEEWNINDTHWIAYIGNLIPKTNAANPSVIKPPEEFFETIERSIRSQSIKNDLHWFRSYYAQQNEKITMSEFLMDNQPVAGGNVIFNSLPIIPDVQFFSCRNFIIVRRKN